VLGLKVRAGVHTGEIEVQPDGDISGIAVHIAARVAALAYGGQVLVSSTVRDLAAGSTIGFAAQGARAIKGVDEEIRLFSAAGR
jgi:class 3 adenylate cyclase